MPDLGKATFTLMTNSKPFNTGLVAAEARAAQSSKKIGGSFGAIHTGFTKASRGATKMSKSIDGAGKQMQRSSKSMMKGGALIGIGLGFAIKTGIKFDKTMSTVRAATGASQKDFLKLRKAALAWGASTQFSATKVAEAMVEMGKAGFNTQQTLQSMPGVLAAAAASGEDMATVSSIMVNTLAGFGMEAGKATIVADGLAYSANATTASIADFGEAMKYVAPVARKAGLSFHETNGALVALAKVGIKGSMAGTALRSTLLSMQAPNKRVSKQMAEMGLSFRDAQGNMLPLATNIDRLKAKLKGMSKSDADKFLVKAFGKENLTAMQQFLEIGGSGLRKFEKQSLKSKGAAESFAKILRDNLGGDLENMGGAAETAAIKMSDDLAPAIRKVTKALTKMINKYNEMDPAQRKMISFGVGGTAAFLMIAGVVGLVAGTIVRGVALMIKPFGWLFKVLGLAARAFRAISFAVQTFVAFSGGALGALGRIFAVVFKPIGLILRAFVGVFGWVARGIAVAITAIAAFLSIPVWVVAAVVAAVVIAAILIVKYWDKIKSATITAWNAVVNALKAAWTKISSWVSTGANKVKSIMTTVFNAVAQWFRKWWPLLLVIFTLGLALLYRPVKYVLTQIWNFFVQVWNRVASAARSAWTQISAVVAAGANAVANFARAAGTRAWQMFQAAIRPIIAVATSIWNAVRGVVSAAAGYVSSAARAVGSRAKSAFQAAMKAVVNIAKSIWNSVKSAISSVAGKVGSAAKKIGTAIIDGIVQGIKSVAGKIGAAASDAANAALKKAKSALGINSPSKVFADVVGAAIPEGIALGIKMNAKTAVGQMGQLVNQLRKNDVSGMVNTISGAFSTAGPVLSAFFSKANGGLDRYAQKTLAAEVAAIRLLAKGKKAGNELANAYLDAGAALEGLKLQAKQMESALKTQSKLVDDLGSSLQDLQSIQLAGTQAFSDEGFSLDQQMKALELQQVNLKINTGADDETPEVVELQKQIDALRLKADALNLKESLELDPLRRQWDQTINPIKELSFENAVAQFGSLTAQHDLENAKLTELQTSYDSVTASIEAYTQALQAALAAAQELAQTQAAAVKEKTANQKKREALQLQITKNENTLAALVKKGQGQSAAAKNLRITIAKQKSDLAKIPMLAKGGVVDKPTLAMIGEGKETEAVMPLSKLESTVEMGARRAASFLASQVGQMGTQSSDGGKSVTIENVEMKFYGEVDPFMASREMTSSLKARMGGLV